MLNTDVNKHFFPLDLGNFSFTVIKRNLLHIIILEILLPKL